MLLFSIGLFFLVKIFLINFRVGPLYGDLKPFIYKRVSSKSNLKRQTQANFLIEEKFT